MTSKKKSDDLVETLVDIATTSTEVGKNGVVSVDCTVPPPIVVGENTDPFVQMVERLATNVDVDADKLEKLVDVQLRVMAENARSEFNRALSEVQRNLPAVARDAANDQTRSRYARHETIAAAIKPIYTTKGFSTSFSQADGPEGYVRVKGTLRHVAGHDEQYFVDLPLDDKGMKGQTNKTQLHATGSTLTYGRRYLTCLMFDVAVGDDTDGNMPPPPPLTETEQADLKAKAEELFGDKSQAVLESLAKRRFHLDDWHNIPSYRLPDAIRSLEEKAEQ